MAEEGKKDQQGDEQPQGDQEKATKPEHSPHPSFAESVSEEVPRNQGGLPDQPEERQEEGEEKGEESSKSEESDDKAKAAKKKDESATSTDKDEKDEKDKKEKESKSKSDEEDGDDDLTERAKKRFDGLTARLKKQERENAELKAKVEKLTENAESGEEDEGKAGEGDEKPAGELDIEPDPKDLEPKLDDYENDEEGWDKYFQNIRQWERRQTIRAMNKEFDKRIEKMQAGEQEKTVEQQYNKRVNEVIEQGKKLDENFEDLASKVLYDDQMPVVMHSEKAAEILHHLGTNPDEAERMAAIEDPVDFALEVGKLEASLSTSKGEGKDDSTGKKAGEATDGKQKKSSKAPEPLESLGGREKADVDPNDMSTEEYYKKYG